MMASAAEELDVDRVAVRFTNPDKMYFPKLGCAGPVRASRDLRTRHWRYLGR